MAAAIAFLKNGNEAAARVDLKMKIVAERMCDAAMDNYVSPDMQWGLDHEDEAKRVYEEISGNVIRPAGFVRHPKIDLFGATPDGFIDHDGLIEIKCPRTTTFLRWMMDGAVPEQHRPQMLAQIACTGRKWCDFMAYDPRIKFGSQYFVLRFEPTPEQIHEVEVAAIQFLREVDAMFERMTRTDTRSSP
jgi:exodeoxyribonuclease (lambda-induced)